MNETYYRVYNRCKYDIGVTPQNGISKNIKAGSFQLLTANDIMYIESICADRKFFTQHMLVPVDDNNKEVPLEQLHIPEDPEAVLHMSDDEIIAQLKGTVKKLDDWLSKITDPAELHAIYKVATEMDLPASKLKILSSRIPNKDWLDQQ